MKKGLTELVFIIDKSSSMRGTEKDTIDGFNTMLRDQQSVEGEAVVTTILFDKHLELLHDRIDIRAISPMTRDDYKIGMGTALLDAMGMAIHKTRNAQKHTNEDYRAENVMFIIITDGEENSSSKYNHKMIRERIEHYREKHGYDFVFFGAGSGALREAEKLGIPADRVIKYTADPIGIRNAYSTVSSFSTARRSVAADIFNQMLSSLRSAIGDIMESNDELLKILEAVRKNGGKIPDVNEIARKIIGEPPELSEAERAAREKEAKELCRQMFDTDYRNSSDLKKYWSKDIVIVDRYNGKGKKSIPQQELLKGEINAATFKVGCYTVRSADRVYRTYSRNGIYETLPADNDDVEKVKNCENLMELNDDDLYVYNEIHARYDAGNTNLFQLICRARYPKSLSWNEYISEICTAKENSSVPDDKCSLLILDYWIGDSHSTETWYKLSPDNRLESLYLGLYSKEEDTCFKKSIIFPRF